MTEYDNRNSFVLFRNGKKTKDTHPDFTGTFTDESGKEYFADAWSKTPKSGGEKFLSGRMKLKKKTEGEGKRPPSPPKSPPVQDDDIPFAPEFR